MIYFNLFWLFSVLGFVYNLQPDTRNNLSMSSKENVEAVKNRLTLYLEELAIYDMHSEAPGASSTWPGQILIHDLHIRIQQDVIAVQTQTRELI